MKKITLNGDWKLYYYDKLQRNVIDPDELRVGDIPFVEAKVPGDVHLDLSRAGILPADLFKGMNLRETELFETYDWWYEKEFTLADIPAGKKITLKFDAVDCLAEYYLNGELIGTSENAFIPHEFDVTNVIGEKNILQVKLSSVIVDAYESTYDSALFEIAGYWDQPIEHTNYRKAASGYGWDILGRCITYGIWRDVNIIYHDEYEIRESFIVTEKLNDTRTFANMRFMFHLDMPVKTRDKNIVIELSAKCGTSEFTVSKKIRYKVGFIQFGVSNPKLWWPHRYGDANIYDAVIKLYVDGELVCEQSTNFGIRTVVLDRTDVTDGTDGRFCFVVNGVDIMALGTNWVPLDIFHSRDLERVDRALEMAADLQCNIIRCWGGNVYESQRFYDLCDKYGIMIWQDFGMGCMHYPMTEDFKERISAEVKSVVCSLRQHPCIVLWAGDNEVDSAITSNGCNIDPDSYRVTREFIPQELRRHDCSRPYLASSPYISSELSKKHNNHKYAPEYHAWGPRDYFKSSYYTENGAHFISECGYHGCPARVSIEKFIDSDKVWPYTNNEQWVLHSSDQKENDARVMLMEKQIRQLFGKVPDNLDDYALASQFSQAEAKKFFIERIRCGKPTKSGIIWWNLLDGWPQMSDAIVDYYFEKKLAYDFIKNSQKPVALMFSEIDNWGITLVADNNTLNSVSGSYEVTDAESGEILMSGRFSVGANANIKIRKFNFMYSDKKMFFIRWKLDDGTEGFNHYMAGFPPFDFDNYRKFIPEIQRNAQKAW